MHLFVCTEYNYPLIWRKQRANPASLQWHINVSCAAMVWPWLAFKHYGLNFFCFPLSCFFFFFTFLLFIFYFFTFFSLFACGSLHVSQKSHSNKNDNNESNVFSVGYFNRRLDNEAENLVSVAAEARCQRNVKLKTTFMSTYLQFIQCSIAV